MMTTLRRFHNVEVFILIICSLQFLVRAHGVVYKFIYANSTGVACEFFLGYIVIILVLNQGFLDVLKDSFLGRSLVFKPLSFQELWITLCIILAFNLRINHYLILQSFSS